MKNKNDLFCKPTFYLSPKEYAKIISEKEGNTMEELTIKLNEVSDSYYAFIVAVLSYVKKKHSRLDAVNNYLTEHPESKTSDILDFISNQDDFYEDAVLADHSAV